MNIQHSTRTDSWFTPIDIIKRSRAVLGLIDLDPASCEEANQRIVATRIIDKLENGLHADWFMAGAPIAVFCNPPGGKLGNQSKTVLFWQRLMELRNNHHLMHAIFMCFSLEAMQTTQKDGHNSVCEFPICIPKRRIAFDKPDGTPGAAPSHSNAIVYVPGMINYKFLFETQFESLGAILNV